jgi:NAD(P)H-hydrate epimerase
MLSGNDISGVPSHPVLTCAEAKVWEAGLLRDEAAEWAAMQRAGAAIAAAIEEDFKEIGGLPDDARILVLVGKGHNGGDALLAARALLEKFPQATAEIILCFGEPALRPLAKRSLEELRGTGLPTRVRAVHMGLESHATPYDLCLDGIFGFQFRTPVDAAIVQLLAGVNAHPAIKFRAAVDLPSGVGETSAPTVFRADFTYATGIVKSPVLNSVNAVAVGRLRYLDLGFFDSDERPEPSAPERVLLPSILAPLAELRRSQSDKRTYGHLFVVGGSHRYPGAVVLAVRAALRSGTGLVTAFVPEQFAPEYAARHPEAMWVGCPVTESGGLALGALELVQTRSSRASAMLIGPGLGTDPETLALVGRLVESATVPLVLDADALRPEIVAKARLKPFICTPHAGEFERIKPALFAGETLTAPQAVLVLKGPITRITDGRVSYYSLNGGPVLARGGSGDLLAGLTGGLLAQQPENPLLAACRGAVWHGRAADLLARTHGQVAVEISQLLGQLGPALTSIS